MSKVFIEETTLTNIGSAIREKTGKSDLIAPGDMPAEIRGIVSGGGGDIEVEPIVLTGECQYACAGPMSGNYLALYGNTVSTKDISNATNMFYTNTLKSIPFEINFNTPSGFYNAHKMSYMFAHCHNLEELPKLNNVYPYEMSNMFTNCESLRAIPEDYFDDWKYPYTSTWSEYSFSQNMLIYGCYSLRSVSLRNLIINPKSYTGYSLYYNGFTHCYVLDELTDIPVYDKTTWTSNAFNSFLYNARRVKRVTFKTNEDGSPIVVTWKGQVIDGLTWGNAISDIEMIKYNSGITVDKKVVDDATYQTLKNDPDWFTRDANYSRYNRISAVETINTLPDTSAYLATGGTNTIKFYGKSGALTDGGAINTMTEEEIAVAVAKGWTVTFT